MHELSITQEILRIAVEHAERANAKRITDVNLVVGDLSSVVDDSVQFYFDFLNPGTLAEGAQLHFRRIKARLKCRKCSTEFEPEGLDWQCPNCQSIGGDIVTGKEFFLDNIQVE